MKINVINLLRNDAPSNIICDAIQSCTNINEQDTRGNTALIYACYEFTYSFYTYHNSIYYGDAFKIIELIISRGANVNLQNKKGYTALHELMTTTIDDIKASIICLLINAGADPSIQSKDGCILDQFNELRECIQLTIIQHGYIDKIPENCIGNIARYYKKQLINTMNQMEQVQYQIHPGHEFWKLVQEEFSHVSQYDLYKACKK